MQRTVLLKSRIHPDYLNIHSEDINEYCYSNVKVTDTSTFTTIIRDIQGNGKKVIALDLELQSIFVLNRFAECLF